MWHLYTYALGGTMQQFTHDPSFWAFLTAVVGSVRWLLRVAYISTKKNNLEKAKHDSLVEAMKANNTVKLVSILQETVGQMKPTIAEHSRLLEGFRHSFDLMTTIEGEATQMMKELKVQYGNFASEMMKFNAIGDNILGRMKAIETEVTILKSGNIYVQTKK